MLRTDITESSRHPRPHSGVRILAAAVENDRHSPLDEPPPAPVPGELRTETQREVVGEAVSESASPALDRLGDYRIQKELGRGGQGRVYQALDERLGRVVALKVLEHATPEALGRFSREAAATSRLDHPGIAAVYEVGTDRGRSFIAMRYVDGYSLAERLALARRVAADGGPTPTVWTPMPKGAKETDTPAGIRDELARTLRYIEGAARALHVAHERGVVHRDVKPGNLMVTPEGEPVVLDFGLAGMLDATATQLTRSGEIFGTPGYMAPEQIAPERAVADRRTDVYALGVVLFEALTLRRPFERATRDALFTAILTESPPDVRRYVRGLPADVRTVVDVALEKEPHRRYATAADFAEDLRRVRASEPILAKPIGAVGRLLRWSKRRPAAAALALALILGLPLVAWLGAGYVADRPLVAARRAAEREELAESRLDEGFFKLQIGDMEGARASFRATLSLKPDAYEAVVGTATSWLKMQTPETARLGAEELERLPEPWRTEAAPLLAAAYRVAGRDGDALALKRKATAPQTPLGWFVRTLNPLRQNLIADSRPRNVAVAARDAAYRAVLLSPVPRRLHYAALIETATRAAENGDAEDRALAEAAGEAAADHWPTDAHVWWQRGVVAQSRSDPLTAVPRYRRAMELLPNTAASTVRAAFVGNLAGALAETDAKDEAMALFRRLIRDEPEFSAGHTGLVALCQRLGRVAEAEASLVKLTSLRPDDALNWMILGTHRLNSGRPALAVPALETAARLRPGHADTKHNWSNAFYVLGRTEESLRIETDAARLAPDDPMIAGTLVLRFLACGDVAGAENAFAAAAKLPNCAPRTPEHDALRRAIDQRQDALDRLNDALSGEDPPTDSTEASMLVDAAVSVGRFAAAARLLEFGFDGAAPGTSEDSAMVKSCIVYAAAAGGSGTDAADSDPTARGRWNAAAIASLSALLDRLLPATDSAPLTYIHRVRLHPASAPWFSDERLAGLPPSEASKIDALRKRLDAVIPLP